MNAVASKTDRRTYEFDGFRVDPVRRRLMRDGDLVPLTPKAFSILLVLLENRGEIVDKEDLIQKVWPDTFVTEANLTQNISSLRKALGERASDSRYVVTVPGRGYCFAAEVVEVPRESTGELPLPEIPPEASASPAAAPEPEPAVRPQDGPTGPIAIPAPRRRRLQAAGLVLLVLATVSFLSLFLYLYFSRGAGVPLAGTASRRPSVAVMELRNLAGDQQKGWLATALSEMLTTELAAGGRVRLVPGENVARAVQSLALSHSDELKTEDLARLRSMLSADLLVLGSYLSLGEKGGGKIRLDLRVLELPGGETVASHAEVGTEGELFDLVARTGEGLRQALGWIGPSPEEIRAARALRPASPEAARLYVEGLERLRSFDYRNALDLLEKSAAADPVSPVIRSALSQAWTGLGYDSRGAEEAERAFQLAGSLPKQDRLEIEARLYEARKQWHKASDIYGSLWTFYPDNVEHGLRLVNNQIVAGRTREAVKTIAELRALPPPAGRDARIDLAEALAAKRMSNFKLQLQAARAAETKGRQVKENLVVAQALSLKGDALLLTGFTAPARAAFEEAQALYDQEGDTTQVALMITRAGVALYQQSFLREAQEKFESALDLVNRTGSISGRALQLGNLGNVWHAQGDLHRAQALLTESRDLYVQVGDPMFEARTRSLLSLTLLERGEVAAARQEAEKALTLARQAGTRVDEARALHSLAITLGRQGRHAEARRLHETAWDIARSHGDVFRVAAMEEGSADALVYLGNLPLARQRFLEALALKKQMGDRIGSARILGALSRLALRAGDLPAAKRYNQEHLAIARQVGAGFLEAEALRDQGLWSFSAGDLPGARRLLEEALQRLIGMGADLEATSCRLILASVRLSSGESLSEVERAAREVAAWYGDRGMAGHQARALILAAQAAVHQGRIAEARESAVQARALADQSEDREIQVLVTATAASIEIAAGSSKEALDQLQWAIDESKRSGLLWANLTVRLSLGLAQLQIRDAAAAQTLQAVHQEAVSRGLLLHARQAEGALRRAETVEGR